VSDWGTYELGLVLRSNEVTVNYLQSCILIRNDPRSFTEYGSYSISLEKEHQNTSKDQLAMVQDEIDASIKAGEHCHTLVVTY
jgi:hypothetical protein